MGKIAVSVIAERDVVEIQWGRQEPAEGQLDGYALIHQNGTFTFPFRDDEDNPFVLLIEGNGVTVIKGEDQYERVLLQDEIVWTSDPNRSFTE